MSGNAIIAHDEKITPETLIKAINDAELKATREGEKSDEDAQQRQKKRLVSVSISGAFTLLGVLVHWTHFAPKSAAIALFLVAIISGGWFIAPKAVTAARRLAPRHAPAHDYRCAWRCGHWRVVRRRGGA